MRTEWAQQRCMALFAPCFHVKQAGRSPLQDERFRLEKRHFGQYAQMYFSRLQRLVPHMRQKVTKEWPGVKGVEHNISCL